MSDEFSWSCRTILPVQRKALRASSEVDWIYGTDLTWTRKYDPRCTYLCPTKLLMTMLCPSPPGRAQPIILPSAKSANCQLWNALDLRDWFDLNTKIRSNKYQRGGRLHLGWTETIHLPSTIFPEPTINSETFGSSVPVINKNLWWFL